MDAQTKTAFPSGSAITIYYRFIADEQKLRCKYAVDRAGSVLLQDFTEPFPPGTLQTLEIDLDPYNPGQGEYNVRLMGQALRGEGFINLPFLARTYKFFIDSINPVEPTFEPMGELFSNDVLEIELSHPEWNQSSEGSPVSIYYTYTTDGSDPSDPTEESLKYLRGSKIAAINSEQGIKIRAIAIDESGLKSDIASKTYRFMNVLKMTSKDYPNEENTFRSTSPDQVIYVNGYGLINAESVQLEDAYGKVVTIPVGSKSQEKVAFTVYGTINDFYGNGTTTDGTLRVYDESGIWDELQIDIIPDR